MHMFKYKVLAGCSVRQDAIVLQAYLRSLQALIVPADTELRFGFINDGDQATLSLLQSVEPAIVLPAESRPADAMYVVSSDTHHWSVSTFEHLARQKQRLLDYAVAAGYTHVLLVDSDILLEPTTLLSLLSTKASIANAVFWTRWNPSAPPQPQCWLSHPYGLNGLGMEEHDFIAGLSKRQAIRCLGGGACTLIATKALERGVRYHPRLTGLPQDGMWQGEDRTFAILASRLHERQLADGWPDVFHAYHPSQRTQAALDEAWAVLSAPRQEQANYGDQIALILDPMEDKELAESLAMRPELRCIRGRLGGLPLAPEIEAAVLRMRPGDEQLVDVFFPPWHELPAYRGQRRIIKVKLVDCKPYSMPPVLAEVAYAGVEYD